MDAATLRALQAPLKDRYRTDPAKAKLTLKAEGHVDGDDITCRVPATAGEVTAGLHPMTGGDGSAACSGDMLLQALAACSGVTLRAVATALGIELKSAAIAVEGDLDFRGTLGVAKDAPVGFQAIRLRFTLDTAAPQDQLDNLLRLTERYCVVLQTLKAGVGVSAAISRQ
jgi:uncharacterized OsmC-like protein